LSDKEKSDNAVSWWMIASGAAAATASPTAVRSKMSTPVDRLMPVTEWPASVSMGTSTRPIAPVAPATRIRMRPSLGGGAPQTGLPGEHDRRGPAADLKLGEDRREVVADGLGRQAEPARDGRVRHAGREQVEHLALPGGQLRER